MRPETHTAMNGLERTMAFIKGEEVDRRPYHPILMRWAAKYAGVNYRDFCMKPESKCLSNIRCAVDFNIDWVTVLSDPWSEASGFGIEVTYPEDDLPLDTGGHLKDASSAASIRKFTIGENFRCRNRIDEIRIYKQEVGNTHFIVGWVEGPVAEYVDLRRATEASFDFLADPVNVHKAMNIIMETAMEFVDLQIEAGAHCIGIGDAFCSQIGPDLYLEYAFERHCNLVNHVHDRGALAKLHICGNTSPILPLMIKTGADIIDIDHLVPSMTSYNRLLSPAQVFSGKSDPVSVIQDGNTDSILDSAKKDLSESGGRCIVSAGCEITPGTSVTNMRSFASSSSFIMT